MNAFMNTWSCIRIRIRILSQNLLSIRIRIRIQRASIRIRIRIQKPSIRPMSVIATRIRLYLFDMTFSGGCI